MFTYGGVNNNHADSLELRIMKHLFEVNEYQTTAAV